MKKGSNYLLAILAFMLLLFCAVLYAYTNTGKEKERYRIVVLVDDSGTDRWTILKQGLDRAALDYNMEISFLSVTDSLYPNEQIAVINRELQNGTDGLLLAPVSSKDLAGCVDSAAGQIPVVLIGTDILSDTVYPCMKSDDYQMGRELAEAAARKLGNSQKLGILSGNLAKISCAERRRGVMDVLDENGLVPAWELERSSVSTQEKLEDTIKSGQEYAVICLENEDAEELIDFAALTEEKFKIFTIGNTEKVVYYLDKGLIDTLVVPNEFNMAYLAVQEISRQLEYRTAGAGKTIGHTVVNKDNMYDRDIQKLLFPIVQ